MVNAALAGVTTMVAVLPTATLAVTDAAVDAAPALIVTEHQLRKFMTVSVAVAAGGAPVSTFVPWSGVPASGTEESFCTTGAGVEVLSLHAPAAIVAKAAATHPTPSRARRFIVLIRGLLTRSAPNMAAGFARPTAA
jgi:hypothetical protein